tara:strand:- start:673 stop:1134 length:462 start_codon:yes stop_codon:yes gene_type:complete
MKYYQTIVLTFVITALWDVVLRFMSLHFEKLPFIIQYSMPFINDLKPYFKTHTLLAAALIAGFVGATTQPFILYFMPFPNSFINLYTIKFLILTFIISALYGFIMKASNLFPHLEKHYYEKLGVIKSMYHDGISGLIVQITIMCLIVLKKKIL